jgi:pimeloyl-ACP methyl ester carboxylesterase
MSRKRNIGVLAAAGAIGAAVAIRRRRRTTERPEPLGRDPLQLPSGRDRDVEMDDGAMISLTDMGSGDAGTVVLIHGWVNARGVWSDVAQQLLNDGYRVIAYDQRGHGRSTIGTAPCTISRLGDDLHQLLEQLDLHDVTIAGHSMGGMATQSMLIDHREELARVRAVVLVSTGASGIGLPPFARAMAEAVIGWKRGDTFMSRGNLGSAFVRSAFGRSPRPEHLLATRDLLLGTPIETRRVFLRAISDMDLRPGLRDIGVPAAVIVGTADTLTPPSRAKHIASSIPGATLEQLPGRGHMLPFEAPDEVAHLIEVMAKAA